MATRTWGDYFPSRWLKADDLPHDEDLVLTIKGITYEAVGEDETMKLVMAFEEHDKEMVVNKTNAGVLEKLFGHDPGGCIGQKVSLYATEVTYKGQTTLGVRIRLRPPVTAPAGVIPAAKAPKRQPETIIAELGYDAPPPPEFEPEFNDAGM